MELSELNKLEKAIRGIKKPQLDACRKAKMKENVLHIIECGHPIESVESHSSLQKLKKVISDLASKTKPNSVFRARLKEAIIGLAPQKSSGYALQKVFASVLFFLISFSVVSVYVADIPVTKAFKNTYLIDIDGSVEIVRDGKFIQGLEGMILLQGDIIITGTKSSTAIRFIDDSVSRLSAKSELIINKLYQDQSKKSKTEIEVELTQGRVWSQIVNIVGSDSSFKVGTKDVSASVKEKASFDITSDNIISVYDNKVEVSLGDSKRSKKQLVLEGYTIVAFHEQPQVEKIVFNSDEDETWIEQNKEKDKEYRLEVGEEDKEDAKDEAGLTPDSPFYGVKKLNESTKLLLTIGKEDKVKLRIDIAIKRLNEATVLLNDERDAKILLEEFDNLIDEVNLEIQGSEELKSYFLNAVAEEEKDLTVILPGSPLYSAKEALRAVKKKIAVEEQEIREATLQEVEDKIIEVKDLIKEEKDDLAEETMIEVKKAVIDVAYDDVDTEDETVMAEQVETLSAAKVLVEVVEEQESSSKEMVELTFVTHEVLEEDMHDAMMDPDIVVTSDVLHLANPVIDEEVEAFVQEKNHPVVSDSALILDL